MPGAPAPAVRAAPRRRSGLCSALLQAGRPGRRAAHLLAGTCLGPEPPGRRVGDPGRLGHASSAREGHPPHAAPRRHSPAEHRALGIRRHNEPLVPATCERAGAHPGPADGAGEESPQFPSGSRGAGAYRSDARQTSSDCDPEMSGQGTGCEHTIQRMNPDSSRRPGLSLFSALLPRPFFPRCPYRAPPPPNGLSPGVSSHCPVVQPPLPTSPCPPITESTFPSTPGLGADHESEPSRAWGVPAEVQSAAATLPTLPTFRTPGRPAPAAPPGSHRPRARHQAHLARTVPPLAEPVSKATSSRKPSPDAGTPPLTGGGFFLPQAPSWDSGLSPRPEAQLGHRGRVDVSADPARAVGLVVIIFKFCSRDGDERRLLMAEEAEAQGCDAICPRALPHRHAEELGEGPGPAHRVSAPSPAGAGGEKGPASYPGRRASHLQSQQRHRWCRRAACSHPGSTAGARAPERAGGCPRGHGARAGAPAAHSPKPSTQAPANGSHLPPARFAGRQAIRARPPAPSPSPESLSGALHLVSPTPAHGSRERMEDPWLWPPCPFVEHPAGALPELCPPAGSWAHPIKPLPRPDGERDQVTEQGSGRLPGRGPHLQAMWPWAGKFASLSLRCLIWEAGSTSEPRNHARHGAGPGQGLGSPRQGRPFPGPLSDTPINPGMDSGPVQRPHSAPVSSRDCSSPAQGSPATTRSPEGPGRKRGACSGRGSRGHMWAVHSRHHTPPATFSPRTAALLRGHLCPLFLSPGSPRPWKAFSTHPGDHPSADSVSPGDGRGQGLRLWPRAGLHPAYPTVPGPEGPEGTFPALKPAEGSGLAHATGHSPEPWRAGGRPHAEPRGKSPARHIPRPEAPGSAGSKGGQLAAHEPAPASETEIGWQTRTDGKGSSPGQGPQSCRDTRNPEQTDTTEARGLLRTRRLVGWRERKRRVHGRVRAAELLSWQPGRQRAGWRGGRSKRRGVREEAGRGLWAERQQHQSQATVRRQRESPFRAGPWPPGPTGPKQQDAPGARVHQRSLQDQQGTRDSSAGQWWSCTGPRPRVRCPIATPALTRVSAAWLGRLARPWALGIPHAAPCQGDSPDRRAHRQAGRTRPWSPTPTRPDSRQADRFLWGRLLTWERGEAERLPQHVGLTRERQREESRRLGQ
ncbi:collagen alpha-1(I) chain-like [Muntiacus reevesi]|uniref:collagen alpha-1(I) chain-like n=1 Tax=Muntiacus reevesi TaxID=9886 RepID=UPI003306EC89